jgi:hypothetical protein
MILIVVLGIAGTCLVAIIIYITLRLKHRRSLEVYEPYQGTLVDREHPAAQITPFGGGGPHSGRTVPQFSELTYRFFFEFTLRHFVKIHSLQDITLEKI